MLVDIDWSSCPRRLPGRAPGRRGVHDPVPRGRRRPSRRHCRSSAQGHRSGKLYLSRRPYPRNDQPWPVARPDDTLSTLLGRADKALDDAKHRGRNRFALAACCIKRPRLSPSLSCFREPKWDLAPDLLLGHHGVANIAHGEHEKSRLQWTAGGFFLPPGFTPGLAVRLARSSAAILPVLQAWPLAPAYWHRRSRPAAQVQRTRCCNNALASPGRVR